MTSLRRRFVLVAAAVLAAHEDLGPNLIAELYSLVKHENLTGVSLENLAALEAATTPLPSTTTAVRLTEEAAPRTVTCGYKLTSKCDVSKLLPKRSAAVGDVLQLALANSCLASAASTPTFASYGIEAAAGGRLWVDVPRTVAADTTMRLCEKQLVNVGAEQSAEVTDLGEVRFLAQPEASDVTCAPTEAASSGGTKFLSLFDSVRCELPLIERTDAGYFFTVDADATCADLNRIDSRKNMKCGVNPRNSLCTFTLRRFEGESLRLCRCDLPVPNADDNTAASMCTRDMPVHVATLSVAAEARRLQVADLLSLATAKNLTALSGDATRLLKNGRCSSHEQCGSYGRCINEMCAGFHPDQTDTKLIRCVEGYRCDVAGEVSGLNVSKDFQVIGVSPGEMCGVTEPLPAKLSIFSNTNRWRCSGQSSQFCQFSPGVGQRRNKTIALEGLRLCGCPNADMDNSSVACDSAADFYVPLAKLGVQECLTNAHCLHKTFAYCVNDHCAGFMGIAASAGMKAYQCLLNKSCSVQSIAAKTINEGLKIVPVAASFNCGAEQALDATFYQENALPCVMDINGDGHCDIHLGVPKALGTNRLCGCNGSDRGGNGRACDEPEDFDVDLGLLTVDECNMDTDCANMGGGVCIAKKCYVDSQAPYAVSIKPTNATESVPPVSEIRITFSETIRFPSSGGGSRRVVLISKANNLKYELPISDPTTSTTATSSSAHRVHIEGKDLVIIPDLRITSLPEGLYALAFEGGIVEDLQGNGNVGSTSFTFTITSDGGCPFMGVTGFGIDSSLNINGIYRSTGILNGKPKWTSIIPTIDGLNDNSQIFWYPGTSHTSGRWVIGLSHDHSKFLSYLDVPFPTGGASNEVAPRSRTDAMRPTSGSWKKWARGSWQMQSNVLVECIKTRVTTPPRFVDSSPLPGAVGVTPERFEMTFTFDRPVTFGHWSQLALTSVEDGVDTVLLNPEDEDQIRNKVIFRNLVDNQMVVRLGEYHTLKPGTEYWVTVDTGAFTDLQYNPVAPIVKGDFKFTTYGRACRPYPVGLYDHVDVDYGRAKEIAGSYAHAASAVIKCATNYSPRFKTGELDRHRDIIQFGGEDSITTVNIECEDGEWTYTGLNCLAECKPYQTMGSQYDVLLQKLATDNDDLLPFGAGAVNQSSFRAMTSFKAGTQLKVSCANNSETLAGSAFGETTTCVNGRWSSISLRCGVTCPPFPDLGRAYTLSTSATSAGFAVGSSRTVLCNSDALGDRGKTETLVCQENGTWQTVSLHCYYNCPTIDVAAISHTYGLEPLLPTVAMTKSWKAGETHIFKCMDDAIAKIEEDGDDDVSSTSKLSPLVAYWTQIDQHFPTTSDRQTQISCVEGQWLRRRKLTCLKSCSPYTGVGPGYNSRLVIGDGTAPGSSYELSCKADAVQNRRGPAGSDEVVCLRGEWTRVSRRLECLGACVHPVTYFGANYRVIDQNSGLALSAPSTAIVGGVSSLSTTYRHHSQSFVLECSQGMQPLDAPLVADPSLHYIRGRAPSDPDAPVKVNEVSPMTGLFESPSQLVHCSNGEWLPSTGPSSSGAGLLRCSPYCPPLNSMYSQRFLREDTAVGFSWGSKRQFKCANGLTGAHFGRYANGTLGHVSRSSVVLLCARGAWIAPPPPFDIPELTLTYTPLNDMLIVKSMQSTIESVQQAMAAALPCGRSCQKNTLEGLLRRSRLRLTSTTRADVPQTPEHGFTVAVACEVGTSRLSGPAEDELIGCSDGEWTLPLTVCGQPSCHDGAINQDEEHVDCGGKACSSSAACPANLHSCELDKSKGCAACASLPEPTMLHTSESAVAGGIGVFVNSSQLPLPHGALLHTHPKEYFNLPMTAVSSLLYTPYLCVNGSWEKLQATRKRLLEESPEESTSAAALAETAASGLSSSETSAHSATANVTGTNDSANADSVDLADLPKELNGLSELAVQSVSCTDGVLSRGEWGVDCGGVCKQPCPDCFDRTMNGNEVWVDCGGDCRSCSSCSLADLKAYDGEAYTQQRLSVDLATGVVKEIVASSTSNPAHGAGVRINCSHSAVVLGGALPLDLVCLDGRWWPVSVAHEMVSGESDISPADFSVLPMYAVRCELASVSELERTVLYRFRSPAITLNFCERGSNSGSNGSVSSSFCCPMLRSYNREMAGECGSLLYSGGVSSFCKGVCYQRLRQLTEFYDTVKEEAVARANLQWEQLSAEEQDNLAVCEQVADHIKTVSKTFCYVNSAGTSSASGISSEYCFTAAGSNLGNLRSLNLFTKAADIDLACAKGSCFRNNVEYVDTMWQLLHMKSIRLATTGTAAVARRLGVHTEPDFLTEAPAQYRTHLQNLLNMPPPNELMLSTVDALLSLNEEVVSQSALLEPLEDEWRAVFAGHNTSQRPTECPARRLGATRGGSVAPVLGSIFRDPASVQYSDTIVPLMCLKDSKGTPCTSQFQQILQALSLWSGQSSMPSLDRVKLGQAVASLAATCNESSCFLQLSRHLGQEVSERGIARGDPYQRFMGLFLKLFGRYFCQNDAQGNSCAVKYLGWLIQGMQPAPSKHRAPNAATSTDALDASIKSRVPNCDKDKCDLKYINDGICDPQCFNLNCGFDGGDCLIQNMYPGILERLMTPIALTNPCHPLNANLKTCPNDLGCHRQISEALISHGCCFAVGVDMLKEILDLEFYSHPLIRADSALFNAAAEIVDLDSLRTLLVREEQQKNQITEGDDFVARLEIGAYDNYTPDRSSIYSQTLCNLYQDRTCSRGMARRILVVTFETNQSPSFDALAWMMIRRPPASLRLIEFPYDSIDYDEFRRAVESEVPVLRLKVQLRKQLSEILVLPATDIREVDIWPVQASSGRQAALVEIIVDPSLFIDETRNTLQTMQSSGEFQDLISATVAQWRKGNSQILEDFLSVMESRTLAANAPTVAASGRRLQAGLPVEVDQKKGMQLNVAAVRQMPVTRIQNVQFKILALDPISTNPQAGGAVDSLPPSQGTFDLGHIAGVQRLCSARTLVSDHDPWGSSVGLPFSNYEMVFAGGSASITGYDGETIEIGCRRPNFSAKAGCPERQKVVCNNGRWISADREALLECVKPCSHFHLQTATPDVYRVVGEGNSAGSSRRVSCAAGYSSTGSSASQLLVCQDGEWSALTLECQRATVFDGTCAGVPLDFLVNNYHYKITSQTNAAGTAVTMPNSVWWKAVCQRGYEMSSGTEPLYLVCLEDQRLLSFGLMSYHLQQQVLKPPSADGLESALRQFVADTSSTGQIAEVDLARLMWASELPLKTSGVAHLPSTNVTRLVCTETVITKPELLVESGIDDWVYIGVVGSIAFGATILFGLWGYYWQTRGRVKRNTRKARKLAAAAANNPEAALLAEPTADGVPPKFPSTEASDLFPSSKPPLARASSNWPQGATVRRDDHSSNGYYSDVEYYAKPRQ